jgi:hypothetical protein
MSEWLGGFLCGGALATAVCLIVGKYLGNQDHQAWLRICDRYESIIARLMNREDDPADFWKNN